MSQKIAVSVQMDAQTFRDSVIFDLFHHRKRWRSPLLFTCILLVSSGICMTQIGKRDGAGLLTTVLAIIALGIPAVYFGKFFYDLSKQIKKMNLPRPFYRLEVDSTTLRVWMAGQQDKAQPTAEYALDSLYCVYRTENVLHIYVQPAQAYLLNESTETFWKILSAVLPAEKMHDCRSKKA